VIKVESVVVGAGVVGLAIARALALRNCEVLLLEKERVVGTGISSRNSEVIHAGLYYHPGSLKAELCVGGRHRLYQYCEERRLPYRRCGKLVVATDANEDAYLVRLQQQANANGVEELELIGASRMKSLETQLRGTSALLCPHSGIIDSHALMLSYQADAEAAGCMLAMRAPAMAGAFVGRTVQLCIGGVERAELEAELVINCAGLDAWELSSQMSGLDRRTIPPRYLAKGNYFTLTGARAPFRHLIYPVPEPGGLGIHLTLDLAGQARFGPDVEWVDDINYNVDPGRARRFYTSIRRYWPELGDGSLMPAYSGIRPKTTGLGEKSGDFMIQGPSETGHPGYIALYGIESPGLTASLAIGDWVAKLALG
jgi:L-2-hydroxyglutarate oxidase LhgO